MRSYRLGAVGKEREIGGGGLKVVRSFKLPDIGQICPRDVRFHMT